MHSASPRSGRRHRPAPRARARRPRAARLEGDGASQKGIRPRRPTTYLRTGSDNAPNSRGSGEDRALRRSAHNTSPALKEGAHGGTPGFPRERVSVAGASPGGYSVGSAGGSGWSPELSVWASSASAGVGTRSSGGASG